VNSRIQFFSEGTSFIFRNKNAIRVWLVNAIEEEQKKPWYINFIFCDDKYLLELNKVYLKHNTLTDILTFPFNEQPEAISGDIYISIERVEENSKGYGESKDKEIKRVMIHGILHLCGYKDKTHKGKKEMREKEDYYLNQLINSEERGIELAEKKD
jgi:rRNA maturation RNase YbeY